MKKILIIILFVTFCSVLSTKVDAQTYGVPDTLAYLQTIVANRTFYIGKPFSVLNDSLKIKIKFFSPFASIHYAIAKETSTSFSFYFPQSTDDHYLSYPRLEIFWQPYLNATQSRIHFNANNGGGWSQTIANYYATGIVSDIKVLE